MKNIILRLLFLSSLLFSLIVSDTCTKLKKEMLVSTGEITNLLANTADATGQIIDLGDGAIQYGHCWAKTTNVDIAVYTKSELGTPTGAGGFTSQLTNLEAGTKYYIKAYLSDGVTTVYGKEISFTTTASSTPVLTTTVASAVTAYSASSGGNITSDGGTAVTAKGVCWSIATGPTVANSKTSDGAGTGSFASSVTGLTANTKYYIRAYATNSAGTGYGNELTFTTNSLGALVPTLSTANVTSITQTTATSGGNITSDGGASITAKGVCWSTTTGPTVSDSKTSDGTGSGSFVSSITGLTSGTKYYIRSYATNGSGTAYGNELNFTTNGSVAVAPTLSTATITNISQTGAISGGNITSDGGATITSRGVCWSITTSPTISDNKTSDASGSGIFVSTLSSLSTSTKYYVRAYAVNSAGISYGDELSFTTNGSVAVIPTLNTTAISAITQTGAASGGTITNDGGATVTDRGVCWSTASGPMITDNKTSNGTGTGTFASSITGLTSGTKYYIRAYATNSVGTAYGNELSFTTSAITAVAPTVNTATITGITQTGATSGGNISSDGGASVTAKGVCWGTASGPTILDNKTSDGTGTGIYVSTLSGLTASTKYYVRAYATNSVGTSYGDELFFTTNGINPVIPTLTTTAVTNVTQTGATSGGNITSDGGASVTARGVCWSTTSGPTLSDSKTSDASGAGSYVSNITGLAASTKYYVRAYATNSVGTAYGTELNFTTSATAAIPALTTADITAITQTGGTSGGNITSDGGASVTARGVCWSASTGPTISDNKTSDATGTGIFASTITGLTANTKYYVRAYATNSVGTAYGNELNFTTNSASSAPPTAAVASATLVTNTAATLNGAVNANGSATTVTFEYGPTILYGLEISATPATATGTSITNVSAALSGLIPGTLYHYRVKAVNSGGTSYSTDMTFTTTQVPVSVTEQASLIANTTVTLNGTVNANNLSTTVTFEYGLTIAYGSPASAVPSPVTGGTPTTVSSAITGLTQGTTYHYRVKAASSGGTSYGDDVQFVTLQPPTATTSAATSVANTTATLNGVANAKNSFTTITFEYGLTTSYGSTITAAQSPLTGNSSTNVSADVSGLTPGKTYHFKVKAVSAGGTADGGDMTFTMFQAPTVSTTAATLVANTTATVNGNVNANNYSTVVTFEYGLTNTYGSTASAVPSPVTGTVSTAVSANLTGLTEGQLYHFRVKAVSSGGTVYGDDLTFTTLQQPTPTTGSASAVLFSTATLYGTVNANNSSTTVTFEYGTTISYGTSIASTPGTVSGSTPSGVSADLTGLTAGTLYHFRVKAVSVGGTVYGNDNTFTTNTPPTIASVTASPVGTTTATLNCTVNANGQSTTIFGFEYGLTASYGYLASGTPGTVTGNTPTTVTSSITGLSSGTLYHYRVRVISMGITFYSSDNTLTTQCIAPSATTNAASSVTNSTSTLNGIINANNSSTTVSFDYGLTIAYGSSQAGPPSPVTGTGNTPVSAIISGLTPNTLYHYRVKGINCGGTTNGGNSTFTTLATLTTTTISNITSTTASSGGTIVVDGGQNITARGVCWSTSINPTISNSKTSDGTGTGTFTSSLTGLTLGTTYYVRAYATNNGGTSYGNQTSFVAVSIGDSYQGGKVAWILQDGDPGYDADVTHGLIVSPNDLDPAIIWGLTYTNTGAMSPLIGDGNANTEAIVATFGTGNYAARLCYDLVLGGYSDWYLPSKDELRKLYLVRGVIGTLYPYYYWSSSQVDPSTAWVLSFSDGSEFPGQLMLHEAARPIRSF
jgi:hypothetical protein